MTNPLSPKDGVHTGVQIRPYRPEDKERVLTLINVNTPSYFHPSEKADLLNYLTHEVEAYFVAVSHGSIVGSGGINYFPDEAQARIAWDIVHPEWHGKGVGRLLVQHRLAAIGEKIAYRTVVVRTSQITFKFYEKMGFRLDVIEKDFWAKGFDLYLMKKELGQETLARDQNR